MTIESTNDNIPTAPAITYSECYAQVFLGDCFDIPIPKYDYIISDLPYNTGYADWDKGFNANKFFQMKAKGFVLFAVQPLTSELIMANKKQYKYDLVWSKNCYKSNSFKTRPGRQHETILVFGDLPYNAQLTQRTEKEMQRLNYEQRQKYKYKNPGSVLFFDAINNRNEQRTGHPAEKPLDLMDWIIKTYTNEGDIILDPFMGSGTTGVACLKNNRNFIGIEKDENYFKIAEQRMSLTAGDGILPKSRKFTRPKKTTASVQ